jgi:hypothetical protein
MQLGTLRLSLVVLLAACGGQAASTPVSSSPPPKRAEPASQPAPTEPEVGGDGSAARGAWALPAWAPFDAAVQRGTRTVTGAPGPRYWQQYASYKLEAELVPTTKRLHGRGTITYENRSPGALPVLYIHAYPNLFAPEGKRNTNVMSALGGIIFTEVGVEGRKLDSVATGAGWTVNGTVMELRLPAPLAAGGKVTLQLAWNYRVPPDGAPRGGQDRETYVMSYWYPQVAVYDDVNGWQADQYLGNAEFYMGYADYDVALTVPAGWLVASTGELQNAADVLAPVVRERMAKARGTAGVTTVVPDSARGPGKATLPGTDGKLTWRFTAKNVRDVTWATSALWTWDMVPVEVGDANGDGAADTTMVDALYRIDRVRGGWADAAKNGAEAIAAFSKALWPYPWPHMTVVDGPASCGGMEYPMLTCIGGGFNPRELYVTEAHEIAHMWFPMMVGSDEKRFAWQDEGMAQYFEALPTDTKFPGSDDLGDSRRMYLDLAADVSETELMRHGDKYPSYFAYGVASYYKPATVLHALRNVLGDSTFTAAFREYGRRWMYKHPTPRDFFNTFSQVAGRDLEWFWRSWYYETWRLDVAIDRVTRQGDSARVEVDMKGKIPMPVPLVARGAKGDTTTATIPVEAWLGGERKATVVMKVPADLLRIEIDPDRKYPDVNPLNQTWPER